MIGSGGVCHESGTWKFINRSSDRVSMAQRSFAELRHQRAVAPTPPNTSLEPTATSRCDEMLVGVLDHAQSVVTAVAGLWLSSIR